MEDKNEEISSSPDITEEITTAESERTFKSARYIVFRIIILSLGSYHYGFSWTVYNQIFDEVKQANGWNGPFGDWIQGGINSIFIFTAIFGCFFLSIFKNYRRLRVMVIGDIVSIVGGVCLLYPSTGIILAGRVLQGFIAGMNSVLVPLYIKEYAPAELYPKMTIMVILILVMGQVSSFIIGAPISVIDGNWYWRVCILPSILVPIIRIIMIQVVDFEETPTYHLLEGNRIEAERVLNKIYHEWYVQKQLEIELAVLSKKVDFPGLELDNSNSFDDKDAFDGSEIDENVSIFELLKTEHHFKIVLLGIFSFFAQQFSGVNAVNFYSTTIFKRFGSSLGSIITGVYGIVDIITILIFLLYIIDAFNRKTILVTGCLSIGIILILIGTSVTYNWEILSIVLLFLFISVLNMTYNTLIWTVISEMTHSKLINLTVASHWVYAFLIAQFFPVIIRDSLLGMNRTFFMFGFLTFFNGIIFYLFAKETKGLAKDDIYALFSSNRLIGNISQETEIVQK